MSADGSKKAIFAAAGANFGIALAKFAGFAVTGSAAMLAEAIHSVADTSNQGLLLYGDRRSTRVADRRRHFGYARERYFWSFVVALVIFTLGGMFALYEGVTKLLDPHEAENLWVAVGVLVFAIILEGFSFRTAIKESTALKRGVSWWKFIRTSKRPELPVVLLEDFGALTGLTIALVGVGLSKITGNARFDAAGSLAIGLLLCAIAFVLAIEMKSLLLGEPLAADIEVAVKAAILGSDDVESLVFMDSEHLGPEQVLCAVKVVLTDESDSADDVARAINRIEVAAREAAARFGVQLEPLLIEPGLREE